MSEVVETVLITTENGDVLINKSDYDVDQADGGAKQYTLAADQTPPPVDAMIEPTGGNDDGNPDQKLVMKDGKKFYVVSKDGVKVVDTAGIDNEGYGTEADAWKAITDLQLQAPPT